MAPQAQRCRMCPQTFSHPRSPGLSWPLHPIASALPLCSLQNPSSGPDPCLTLMSSLHPTSGMDSPPTRHMASYSSRLSALLSSQMPVTSSPHPSTSSQDMGYSMALQALPCRYLLLYLINTRHPIHQTCAWTLPGSPGDFPHQYKDLCGKTTYPVLDCNPHLDSPLRSSQIPSGRLTPPLHRREAESRRYSTSSPPCPSLPVQGALTSH